jgi:hypothetical protein
MPSLRVPVVKDLPAVSSRGDWVVVLADGLLTALLQAAPSALYAGWNRAESEVYCWLWTGCADPDAELAWLGARNDFRSLLARIGCAYLGGAVYGGERTVTLVQEGRAFRCWLRMSNTQTEGYWLQAMAEPD